MQLLHALKLGDNSKLDRLADAWIRGRVKPGQLRRAIRRTDSKARARLDERSERHRVAMLSAVPETPVEAVQAPIERMPWDTAEQPLERIVEPPTNVEEDIEDVADGDEELAALFAAIEDIQAGNRERIAAKVKKKRLTVYRIPVALCMLSVL